MTIIKAAERPLIYLGLLCLCSAYIQGGFDKLTDIPAATAEMAKFGLQPAGLLAIGSATFEAVAGLAVLFGYFRPPAAIALALFTSFASYVANSYWAMSGPERILAEDGFFEHLGLSASFAMVAWLDWTGRLFPNREAAASSLAKAAP